MNESTIESKQLAIRFRLHPKQALVLRSPANEILFGGAAGPGKSYLARAAAILYCAEIPGLQAYLFRRTYPELLQTHMEGPGSFRIMLAEAVNAGQVSIVKNEIRFANGSRISLNHCQYETDVFRFQGAEIQLLEIDELTHFPKKVYTYLRTRCRLGTLSIPDRYIGKFPMCLLTSNPGGPYHTWVKEDFVDLCAEQGATVLHRMSEDDGGMLRSFIPAFFHDNPDLLKNDPKYMSKLRGVGDPETVRALVYGDWDVVSGAMFGSRWRKDRNVVVSFPIPEGWEIWRGADDGYANPACVLWFAKDPIMDRTFVISEIYEAGMLPEDMAQRVKRRDKSIATMATGAIPGINEHTLAGLIDPSSFADTGTGAPARGNAMNKMGCYWRPAEKYPGSRIHGIQHIHRILSDGKDGKPRLQIFEGCRILIKALPTVPRDPDDPEDTDDEFELSHAIDALRYGLQWRDHSFKKGKITGI